MLHPITCVVNNVIITTWKDLKLRKLAVPSSIIGYSQNITINIAQLM